MIISSDLKMFADFFYTKSNFFMIIFFEIIFWFLKHNFITMWTFFKIFVSKSCSFNLNISCITFAWKSTAISIKNIININKLDLYHENRVKFNDWFMQINVYFTFNNVFNDKKKLFAFKIYGKMQKTGLKLHYDFVSIIKKWWQHHQWLQ